MAATEESSVLICEFDLPLVIFNLLSAAHGGSDSHFVPLRPNKDSIDPIDPSKSNTRREPLRDSSPRTCFAEQCRITTFEADGKIPRSKSNESLKNR